jgi:ferredoxin
MKTDIYYFSGTGNSLVVARDLAKKLDARLVSIPSAIDQEIFTTDADSIGFVFPVYYANLGGSGVPIIVERFIKKFNNIDTKYLFAVCTHGGEPAETIENLEKMIHSRGGTLAAGFSVKMGYSYTPSEKINHALFHKNLETDILVENKKRQEMYAEWAKKLESISQYILTKNNGHLEKRSSLKKKILVPFIKFQHNIAIQRYQQLSKSNDTSFEYLIPLADKSFYTTTNCKGCGTCVKVCPVKNIVLVDNKPVWQHKCETCYACFHWCPQGAIHGDVVEYEKRYHYPAVSLKDMLRQN